MKHLYIFKSLTYLQAGPLRIAQRLQPIVVGLLYLIAILPYGLALRLLGKDPLRRRFLPDTETYWIERPPQTPTHSMRDQF